jgi:predicted nucleic acid-binding protein
LTIYDATYLELAQRRRLELATLDKALARAARSESIALSIG